MTRIKFIPSILVIFSVVFLAGCVSKKKYLDMESGRRRAERRVVELTKEKKSLQKDIQSKENEYNSMRNQLLASNSVKDTHIDSLSKSVVELNHNATEKDASMEEQIYSFKFEKRRLLSQLEDKDKDIIRVKSKINMLATEKRKVEEELIEVKFEASKEKDEMNKLGIRIKTLQEDLIRLQAQLKKTEKLRQKMADQIASKDETIERLSNNVKLLKSQMGK